MSYLVRFPSWSTLKSIGGSYFASWTMIVPFLGYLILFGSIAGTAYSIDLSSLGMGQLPIHPNHALYKLRLTFVGLSTIGLATLAFRMICPRAVAKYRDRDDYVINAAQSTFPDEARRKLEELSQRAWYDRYIPGYIAALSVEVVDLSLSTAARTHSGGTPPPLDRSDWLARNLNALNAIHAAEYELENYRLIGVRYIIFLFFSLGFVATMIPSLEVFWSVLKSIIISE